MSLEAFVSRTLGIIGESGSGKTTLGRVITGLMSVRSGQVGFEGRELGGSIGERERLPAQVRVPDGRRGAEPEAQGRKDVGPPRSPSTSISPGQRWRDGHGSCRSWWRTARELRVAIPEGQRPGGERQRVSLARALAAEPKLIICDEITSALDTVVASAILDLLRDLQERLGGSLSVHSALRQIRVVFIGKSLSESR